MVARMKDKILLIEDEENLAIGLKFNLKEEGYETVWARDGREGLEAFRKGSFQLVILDIMLPFVDGFSVAEQIRRMNPRMPILILSARREIEDKVKGLEIGADDYMTKPFHLEELLLRVRGILKRQKWYQNASYSMPEFSFGKNRINFENLTAFSGNKKIQLTAHEAMLMKYLIDQAGKAVSRKEILEKVWHLNVDIETRTVDNFIVRLRKYFENDPERPEFIKSVRSIGYMFDDRKREEKNTYVKKGGGN